MTYSVIKALKNLILKDVVYYSLANVWYNLNDKVIVCSWKNLWPDIELINQYNKSVYTDEGEINRLQEVVNQKLVDYNKLTIDDLKV